MKKTLLRIVFLFLLSCAGITAAAQITVGGSDPGRLRWFQVETPSFRIIYPSGSDSLARVYARLLEGFRPAEAPSSGFLPGGLQGAKTPVILHTFCTVSNGSVTWAPKRMDLYTVPNPYDSDPTPWDVQLAVHESRHLAQMQFGYQGPFFRTLSWLLGEMWPGAAAGVYPNQALLEGDAVVAETALAAGGRARTADFLSYYHVAFDNGDWRNWYRWRYGSFKRPAPDHYALGYVTVAGMRYFHDDPLFVRHYFERVTRHPLAIGNLQHEVKAVSGQPFRKAFRNIQEGLHAVWTEEAEARAPFMPAEQVVSTPSFATEYAGSTVAGGELYLTKSSLDRARSLIRLSPDGTERRLRAFPATSSRLFADEVRGRIYWSETVRDPRWELGGTSRIFYYNRKDGRVRSLTAKGRFYNPQPAPDGSRIAVADYPAAGGTAVSVLSADNGALQRRFPAPDGIQVCEIAWGDDVLYATAVTENGYGIYRIGYDGQYTPLAAPSIQKISTLDLRDGLLWFVSDRTGVNELYSLDPADGTARQWTSSRYGGKNYVTKGDSLYFVSPAPEGSLVFRTSWKDLTPKMVRLEDVHRYRIEDALTAQETVLSGGTASAGERTLLSAPARYRKFPHLFHIHSWAPVYVNYDDVESFSFDFSYRTAWLGATAFFQNTLGTAYGSLGYSPHPDPYGNGKAPWRHSGHLKFTYTGLYPVFELNADFNDRSSLQYTREVHRYAEKAMVRTSGDATGVPAFSGTLRAYVPLSFSSGGWRRGLVPQVTYGFTNDRYSTGATVYTYEGEGEEPASSSVLEGNNVFLQSLSASIRGYVMRPTAPSQAYPSLGIGAEVGFSGRPGIVSAIAPVAYGYLYGYLPGLLPAQGLRLTAMVQRSLDSRSATRESRVNVLPRGFETLGGTALMNKGPWQGRLTADYAIPVYVGDLSFLSPVAYVSHFLLTPHCDVTFFGAGNLVSAGATFAAQLKNLLWAPFDGSFGVTASFNGGSAYDVLKNTGTEIDGRWHVGLVFSMDI